MKALLGTGVALVLLGSLLALAQENSTNSTAGTSPWVAPARAIRKPNPVPSEAGSIAKGKQLYTMDCLPCHGAAGKGDGPAAATLERNGIKVKPGDLSDPKRWDDSDGAIFWKLTEGRTPMPAWGETLSEEQRWLVINYIRTLAPRPAKDMVVTKAGGNP